MPMRPVAVRNVFDKKRALPRMVRDTCGGPQLWSRKLTDVELVA